MRITVYPAALLSGEHVDAWSRIQLANPDLDSPYFRPEFTMAVASVRSDVQVAVLEDRGEPVGFFPHQRGRRGVGRPVGGRLSDFQGVIARKDVTWDPGELLRGCELKVWHFDHWMASQEMLARHQRIVEDSPYVDLSGGFASYCTRQRRRFDNPFPHLAKDARRLERLGGPLRFEFDSRDPAVFNTLIEWKTLQYLRTGATNVFAFPWTRALLEQIWRHQGEAFAGVLCALYAGDRLAAALFSIRSYGVLHHWFPSYDVSLAKTSPGSLCDLETMKLAAERGIHRIDFGKGRTESKESFKSGAIQVAVGSVDLRPLTRVVRRQWQRAYDWARTSPLRRPARVPARILYRVREWFSFR